MLVFEKQVPDRPTYYYRSTGESDKDFRHDMIQVWLEIFKHIRENRPDGSWNRLIFEIWCDQGMLEIYPQKRGESPDLKKPTINVSLAVLDDIKRKLDETDDDAETQSLMALGRAKVDSMIRNTYKKEPALTELKSILAANDFTCWTMHDDDVETLMKFHIFF